MIEPTNTISCDPPCAGYIVAHDPDSDEGWTLDELIDHANGCEEQIDYLLATVEDLRDRLKAAEEYGVRADGRIL